MEHVRILLCLLLTWQDLQDLTYDRMVRRIPFQYITESLLSLQDVSAQGAGGSGDTN